MSGAIKAAAAAICEHYWAWVSPAGTSRGARICQFCGQPDARWLNHIIEVDLHCEGVCVDCEFAEMPDPRTARPADDAREDEA